MAPSWTSNISDTNWKKIEALQSNALRQITGHNWYVVNKTIRNTLKIQSLQKKVETSKTIIIKMMENSSIPDIMEIINKNVERNYFSKNH